MIALPRSKSKSKYLCDDICNEGRTDKLLIVYRVSFDWQD